MLTQDPIERAAAQAVPPEKLADAQEVFCELCETKAFSYVHYQIELPDAVDELQAFAADSGLVTALGQDRVQALMAEPFSLVRTSLDEEDPPETDLAVEHNLTEYDRLEIARRIERWEADDPKRPRPSMPSVQHKRPASSTVAAFKYVVGLDDPDYLARWLCNHKDEALDLLKILGGKHS